MATDGSTAGDFVLQAGSAGQARPRRVAHRSVAERQAIGKAAREVAPRRSHAGFAAAPDRPDPVAILQAQGADRVADLLPLRYGRMAASPFAFLRGAAAVMAADLAGSTPVTGIRAQVCGDAHLSNFGLYGSPERRLVFDINDFDETLPGPWEFDLKRLVASIEVAARENGFSDTERRRTVLAAVRSYRVAMGQFAQMRTLEVWYARVDVDLLWAQLRSRAPKRFVEQFDKGIAKARSHDHLRSFRKLVTVVDGEPRFRSEPPLLVPVAELIGDEARGAEIDRIVAAYRAYRGSLLDDRRHLLEQFRLVDIARKVVGVGSVGTRAWVALLLGRDDDDPIFLQIKEAGPSVLEEHLGASGFDNAGHRVVNGQRLMQAASGIMLGWLRLEGLDGIERDYYVRQLHDWKGGVEVPRLWPEGMLRYAELCAWTLARAHARSGDSVAIAAYLGRSDVFDHALAQFAADYADQTERDHAALVAAIDAGHIPAITGL